MLKFAIKLIKKFKKNIVRIKIDRLYREVPNLRHCCVLKNGTHASKKCII